ncbi:hypothetical protein O988_09482, partial [Pseudogymnoascus sp. VKM F-3808]
AAGGEEWGKGKIAAPRTRNQAQSEVSAEEAGCYRAPIHTVAP